MIGRACWSGLKRINWTHLDCFERRLSGFFRCYGYFVSLHPWPFILFPILISAALSVGFLHKYEITDATYLYTPIGAQSKYERECIHQKWPLLDGTYIPGKAVTGLREAQMIVTAIDHGNILRPEYAAAINRLNLFVLYDIKITYKERIYNYMDLCLHWKDTCSTNSHVGLISTLFNHPTSNSSRLTYPTARFGATRGYLGSSLGGVITNDSTGLILSAQAWLMVYQLQFHPDHINYISGLWELEFQRRLLSYHDPYIRLSLFHSQTLSNEIKRNADKLAPRFVLSFAILILFAVLVTFSFISDFSFPYIDWTLSKPLLALSGVIGAGMGIASAIGFLCYCGYIFNQIVAVMPFLILAVRLDNTFLMISALRHTSRSLPVPERISQALSEAASAITITVSTDFFSFLTGIAADIPAVQLFCVYTAVAIVITFIYQLTFFLGLLVLAARNEQNAKNSFLLCLTTVSPKAAKDRSLFVRLFNQGTRPDIYKTDMHEKNKKLDKVVDLDWMSKWFQDWYAPVLMHPIMRGLVLVWFLIYIVYAGFLCTQVRQGLEPVKLLVKGSYAIPHYLSLEHHFWHNGSEMQLVVNNAPNLAIKYERDRVKELMDDFSNTNHSMGSDAVQFWLYDFERYLQTGGIILNDTIDTKEFYHTVQQFVSSPMYEKKSEDLYWTNTTMGNESIRIIKSFRASIGMTKFETSIYQIETVNTMRKVAANPKYTDLNVTTFNPMWLFVDQYQEILPNVIQEVVSGMTFMVIIALLLIPHPLTSFWVAVTILSVDVGVVGFMTIWGINLDTISMITIIMSIGFSVDFAAHVAHAFVLSSDKDAKPKDKVKAAMGEIAWPILQGGASTILGVVTLADLESYMVVAFFKTVFLVILLALIHGLVFLPVLLSVFVTGKCGPGKKKNSERDNQENGEILVDLSYNQQQQTQRHYERNTDRGTNSSRIYPVDIVPVAYSHFMEPTPAFGFHSNSEGETRRERGSTVEVWPGGGYSNPACDLDTIPGYSY